MRLRQKGSAISTACNWITNYMIVQVAPIGVENIGYKFYIVSRDVRSSCDVR